jgi:acyl-CoA dehydrogenase
VTGRPDSKHSSRVAERVERFVRDIVIPFEGDPRLGQHGPREDLVRELRDLARSANCLTPHISPDGDHATQRETAIILRNSGLSLLGPVACNTGAPDEGNMYLLGRVGKDDQKRRYLNPMIAGHARSAFLMTELAEENGAGSDPSMLMTTAKQDGDEWVINGRKAFITGYDGATIGIVMANTGTRDKVAATMFLIELPSPAITLDHVLDTIDTSMPGGHAVLTISNLRVTSDNILGKVHEGFGYAQLRLSPARLSHCMRWLGACIRAQEIATAYACKREAFGKLLIDHEGVGFQLADNMIELKQAELVIDWCALVLDSGSLGVAESSIAKVAVSEALYRVADRCVQVMGGLGVTRDGIVEQIFRELRAFRIYDGPTEVHKWSLAKKIKREHFKSRG